MAMQRDPRRNYNIVIGILTVIAIVLTVILISLSLKAHRLEYAREHNHLWWHADETENNREKRDIMIDDPQNTNPFTYEDIFSGNYTGRSPNFAWAAETNNYHYFDLYFNLMLRDADSGSEELLIDNITVFTQSVGQVFMSGDLRYLLMPYEALLEYPNEARYRIYDRNAEPGSNIIDFPNDVSMAGERLLFASWATTSNTSNRLYFSFREDLYFQEDPYSAPVRLTTSGEQTGVSNGKLPFINMLLLSTSPDMQYMIYAQWNTSDANVHQTIWGNSDVIYPEYKYQQYPKSGTGRYFGYFTLYLVDMASDPPTNILTFTPPEKYRGQDFYVWDHRWQDSTHVMIVWGNRIQNEYIMELCTVPEGSCQLNRNYSMEGGWITGIPFGIMEFIDDGSAYTAIIPSIVGELGQFTQVAVVTAPVSAEGSVTYLTNDAVHIVSLNSFDATRNVVYYFGTNGSDIYSQLTQHLWRVGTADAAPEDQIPFCVTCPENNPVPQDCQFVSASLSKSADYLLLTCMGPDITSFHVMNMRDDTVQTVEDNAELIERLATKDMPTIEYMTLNIGGGYEGTAEVMWPPNLVTNGSVLYPLHMFPYGGPQDVTQANLMWKPVSSLYVGGWQTYLASSENVITVRLNGRGTGSRGDDFLFEMYRRVGQIEAEDQILGVLDFISRYPFVDANKVAINGGSYGGFVVSQTLATDSDVIKCGVALAPCTDMRLCASMFLERYHDLDTPEDNQLGYNLSNPIPNIENFRNKKFYVAHGTLDKNAEPEGTIQIIRALSDAGILFTSELFPNMGHSVYHNPLMHERLGRGMTDFLLHDCYGNPR